MARETLMIRETLMGKTILMGRPISMGRTISMGRRIEESGGGINKLFMIFKFELKIIGANF